MFSARYTYAANNRSTDERFKADILVVLAHPDDEIIAAAYVERDVAKKDF
jgi:LmbE family N-acetylglucosaminyl deacetylase